VGNELITQRANRALQLQNLGEIERVYGRSDLASAELDRIASTSERAILRLAEVNLTGALAHRIAPSGDDQYAFIAAEAAIEMRMAIRRMCAGW
jgi:hypothetical protein